MLLFRLMEVAARYAWKNRDQLIRRRPTVKKSAASMKLTTSARATPTVEIVKPLTATAELTPCASFSRSS